MLADMSAISVSAAIRRDVLSSRDKFWSPEDFPGAPDAVAKALSRLAHSGEIRRVRRGLYWRGAVTALGMAPPPSHRLALKLISAGGTGPAGLSAASFLGLTTQVPGRETIAVAGRAPRDPDRLVHFVSRAACVKRRESRLTQAEVALLEVLRDWHALAEVPVGDADRKIRRLVSDGIIRPDRLARASVTEPPRVREGLRGLLGRIGCNDEAGRIRPARGRLLAEVWRNA